jgi:glycosyltransferase involved in cell wall biosynthesis
MHDPEVIYIDYNFKDQKYPNKPKNGNAWYTHGFGGLYSRKFKEFNPDFSVECWKADALAKSISEAVIEGVVFKVFPAYDFGRIGLWSPQLISALKKRISAGGNRIVNVSSFDHLLYYSVAACCRSTPLVVQHHGESPAKYKAMQNHKVKGLFWRFMQFWEKRSMEKTDLVYLLDTEAGNWLASLKPKRLVRTTGVDPNLFFQSPRDVAASKLGLDTDKTYLLYIGKLNKTKGSEWLIDLFSTIKPNYPQLELLLAGCSESDMFYKKAKDVGARLFGTIPQEEISLFMSVASIYYLPKLDNAHYFGGLGMLPVQAMLCNTPVIGGTLKCFPEAHRNEVGFLISSESEMRKATIEILEKRINFAALREKALPYFSWESISWQTASDYLGLLNRL